MLQATPSASVVLDVWVDLDERWAYMCSWFSDVTVEKLQAFVPQLLSLLYAEGLIHGNVTKQVGCLFLGVHPFSEPAVGHGHLTGRPSVVCCVLSAEPSPVNMLDLIGIRSGSAGKHWPEMGRMIVAHRLASGPDLFGQNLTQSARTKWDPGWFCAVLPGTSVEERNRV